MAEEARRRADIARLYIFHYLRYYVFSYQLILGSISRMDLIHNKLTDLTYLINLNCCGFFRLREQQSGRSQDKPQPSN